MKTKKNPYLCRLVGSVLLCQLACSETNKPQPPTKPNEATTQPEPAGGAEDGTCSLSTDANDDLSLSEDIDDTQCDEADTHLLNSGGGAEGGAGKQLTDEMIDALSLAQDAEPTAKNQLEILKYILRQVKTGAQDVNAYIALDQNEAPSTLLGLMILGERDVDLKIPFELLQALRDSKEMDINKFIMPTEDITMTPLDEAVYLGAVHTATWLLENGADMSQIIPSSFYSFLESQEISAANKKEMLDNLAKHGFDFKKIICAVLENEEFSVADKVEFLKRLENYELDFFNQTDQYGDTILHYIAAFMQDAEELLAQLLPNFNPKLYESCFKENKDTRTPWVEAAYKHKIGCAALLIRAMQPEHVRTKPLINAQGNPVKDANNNPINQLHRAQALLGDAEISPNQQQKIKLEFVNRGIGADELPL